MTSNEQTRFVTTTLKTPPPPSSPYKIQFYLPGALPLLPKPGGGLRRQLGCLEVPTVCCHELYLIRLVTKLGQNTREAEFFIKQMAAQHNLRQQRLDRRKNREPETDKALRKTSDGRGALKRQREPPSLPRYREHNTSSHWVSATSLKKTVSSPANIVLQSTDKALSKIMFVFCLFFVCFFLSSQYWTPSSSPTGLRPHYN